MPWSVYKARIPPCPRPGAALLHTCPSTGLCRYMGRGVEGAAESHEVSQVHESSGSEPHRMADGRTEGQRRTPHRGGQGLGVPWQSPLVGGFVDSGGPTGKVQPTPVGVEQGSRSSGKVGMWGLWGLGEARLSDPSVGVYRGALERGIFWPETGEPGIKLGRPDTGWEPMGCMGD